MTRKIDENWEVSQDKPEDSERTAHLNWCKQRALEYVEAEQYHLAMSSFISDINKSNLTSNLTEIIKELFFPLFLTGALSSKEKMRDCINGFN